MGLDVAMGIVILIAAIRGWIQGFVYQSIRLGGMVGCVYLADPVRDQAKPHVQRYLPAIGAEWMDRLLWWVCAALSYVVLVGAATLVLKMVRRPEIPGVPAQRSRNDQFAGFLLGTAKGLLVAAFLAAGIQKYALKHIEGVPWAQAQARTSFALRLNEQYQPAAKVWNSVPVRQLVAHVRRMGFLSSDGANKPAGEGADQEQPVQTASRVDSARPERSEAAEGEPTEPPAAPADTSWGAHISDPEIQQAMEGLRELLGPPAAPKRD